MNPINLYIDPGTGSMLFTVLLGVISAGFFGIKKLHYKLKYRISKKDKDKFDSSRIPFVIFSDNKMYWTTFKPICDEFEKRKTALTYMTMSEDDPAFENQYEYIKCEYIGDDNKAFAKLNMLNADIVLSTTPSLDVYQWKRSKNVKHYVHILHAFNDITSYRLFGTDYYDALLLSGEFQKEQARKLEGLRNLPKKEIEFVGLPYADELLKKVKSASKQENKIKTVLLAPSWGENNIFNKYGKAFIDQLINTGYKIIIRPHPQSMTSEKELIGSFMSSYPETDKLKWNFDNDNFDVLNEADILISDFSSVFFDFALVFDKPIIYADMSFDDSIYDAYVLGEKMWIFNAVEKIGKPLKQGNIKDIKSIIDSCLDNEAAQKARDIARSESWCNMGKSAETITEYLIKKQKELSNN